jgi:hypothetical protein
MLYAQSQATPYGANPYALNTLYGSQPQNSPFTPSWLQAAGLGPAQTSWQQAAQQQAAQQLGQPFSAQQPTSIGALQGANGLQAGQPFGPQQFGPQQSGPQQSGLYQNQSQNPYYWAQHPQAAQQQLLYQLAQHHQQIAQHHQQLSQQLLQLAQQQAALAGYFGNAAIGGQGIAGQQFFPNQQNLPQQFSSGQQFVPGQFGQQFGQQNVAPGMMLH